ncbi:MAG TPA: TonB-dependent receptor [Terracidiphilus sp.]|nr:TonB-dependent receptor [Terracidiphilus sp.]
MTHRVRIDFLKPALVLILFAAICNMASAQATTGQILGQVVDPTGAAISGATVTAIDEEKGVSFSGVTDASGNFIVLSMPPGAYSVTAGAPGFAEARYTHAVLAIDQHMVINFRLKVGNVSASVEVTEAPPVLQSSSAEVGTVVNSEAIVNMPLIGREFFALATLVPGVDTAVGSNMNTFNYSVSGQREFANSIMEDGIESTTNRTQDITIQPNVDSVEEFKVVTSSFNAEFGNAAGGVVMIQTKAGTNHIHGDAFEFFRPPFLTAKTTLPGVDTPQPHAALRVNDFGGTLGGPIKHDRAFLFGAYEGVRTKDAYAYVDSTVPFGLIGFPGDGSVDFSNLVDPYAGLPGVGGDNNPYPAAGTIDPIFDPVVSVESYGGLEQQFTNNVIPASRVSPAGLATLQNFYPKPNLTGIDNGWFRNYEVYSPVTSTLNKVDARFDQVISSKDRLYAIYHWQGDNQLVTDPYHANTLVPGGGDADQANKQDDGAQSISVTYDRILSPTALDEVRFGYSNYYQDQYSLLNGTDYSTKFGVGNVSIPGYPATIGYPQIYMADGYLAGGSTYKPYHVLDENYQISNSFTWSGMQRHEFKFGADLRLLNSHPNFSLFPTGFDYFESFGYAETSNFYYTYIDNAYNWAGGSDLADLVLGLPTDVYIGLQLTKPHTKSWNLDWYAQDAFKITPRLTLNYGLRYEYQNPWTEANNFMSNYDIASGNILLADRAGASGGLIQPRKDELSPRFGFAFIIDPKTVVRGGLAIFFSPENDGREDFLTKNAPWAQQAAYTDWVYNGPAAGSSPWEYQLDTGVPRSTTINVPSSGVIDPSTLPNGALETTYAVNPTIKTGTTGSYNLSVQRQLSRTTSIDVAAVGSLSHHLSYEIGDINSDPTNSGNDGLINSNLGKIQYLTDAGDSNYTALQVKLTRQAKDLAFLASYTYSHNLDNGPAPFNLNSNNDSPQNPYDLRTEWASADSDMRHNLVLSGSYTLPFGRGQAIGSNWGPVANAIVGGWRYSPVFRMQTGNPVNVVRGTNPDANLPGLRPDVTGDPNLPRSKRSYLEWFNTSAFSIPSDIAGNSTLPGNAGRNIVVGPAYVNLDSSLAKDFAIEKWTLQVRAEAFNTSNTVHLSNPQADAGNSATFGQINSVIGGSNRRVQLAAKFIF